MLAACFVMVRLPVSKSKFNSSAAELIRNKIWYFLHSQQLSVTESLEWRKAEWTNLTKYNIRSPDVWVAVGCFVNLHSGQAVMTMACESLPLAVILSSSFASSSVRPRWSSLNGTFTYLCLFALAYRDPEHPHASSRPGLLDMVLADTLSRKEQLKNALKKKFVSQDLVRRPKQTVLYIHAFPVLNMSQGMKPYFNVVHTVSWF